MIELIGEGFGLANALVFSGLVIFFFHYVEKRHLADLASLGSGRILKGAGGASFNFMSSSGFRLDDGGDWLDLYSKDFLGKLLLVFLIGHLLIHDK